MGLYAYIQILYYKIRLGPMREGPTAREVGVRVCNCGGGVGFYVIAYRAHVHIDFFIALHVSFVVVASARVRACNAGKKSSPSFLRARPFP